MPTNPLDYDIFKNSVAQPPVRDIRRNPARSAVLAKFLGLDQYDHSEQEMEDVYGGLREQEMEDAAMAAEAKAVPVRAKGQYDLLLEQLKGGTSRDVARMRNDAASIERETAREFAARQNELNRNAIAGRQSSAQAAITGRSQAMEAGRSQRQRAGQAESRAKLYDSGKVNAPRPSDEGWLEWLFGPSQSDLNTQEATRLRSEALGAASAGDPSDIASEYLDVPDDQLESVIASEQTDASPEEIAGLINAVRALRGGY